MRRRQKPPRKPRSDNIFDVALFPNNITRPVYDIPSSDLAQEFVQRSAALNNRQTFWSAGRWTDLNDVPFDNTSPDWVDRGKVLTRGGRTRLYSQDLRSACNNNPINGGGYSPTRIILLTHGFCGSTCAVFAAAMRAQSIVRTVVVGGFSGQPMQYMSFPGGQVSEANTMWSAISTLNVPTTLPHVPLDTTTSANFRYACRAIYSPYIASEYPSEFVFHPSDVHLDNDEVTATYADAIWEEAATHFNDVQWHSMQWRGNVY